MSLRLRLFLVLAGLVVALLAAQVWWVRSLADEMSTEVNAVAFTVGRAVASLVGPAEEDAGEAGATEEDAAEEPGGAPATPHQRIMIRLEGSEPLDHEALAERLRHLRHGAALTVHQPGAALHRIPIPQSGLRSRLDRFGRRLVVGTLALLGVGLVAAAVVAHRVSAPLRQLAAAAREVGRGHLGTRVATRAGGEVGEAIAAFDRMSARLEELDAEARRLEEHRHLGEIGEVARGLVHSLRNPLHALGLSVDELADRAAAGDGEAALLAAAARRQIGRVDRSLRSFLTLAGGGAAAVGPVAPRALVDDVVLEALQDGRGAVRIAVDEPAGPVATLAAVEPELRAVVQALVVNAVEASPAGATVEVELAPRGDGGDDDGGLVLRVRDRGPGLAPEIRRRLFTPHASTKPDGAGMGLYLAHRIATSRYGGRLALADRDGGGTVATLEIGPRVAAAERPGAGAEPA